MTASSREPVFTREQTTHHETARFRWVPFVARLLGNGPLRGGSEPLPANPDFVTAEAVAAVSNIANKAVWRFLAREIGWPGRRTLDADLRPQDGRLWQQSTPTVRFSKQSLLLLLAIYSGTREGRELLPNSIPHSRQTNGDLLLHHLVFRRLFDNPALAGIDCSGYGWSAWLTNPVNALTAFQIADERLTGGLDLGRLFAPDLGPFLPWLLSYTADQWLGYEERRWRDNLESVRNGFRSQTCLVSGDNGRGAAFESADLLIPFLEYFPRLMQSRHIARTQFEMATQGLSLRERQLVAGSWRDFLRLPESLV